METSFDRYVKELTYVQRLDIIGDYEKFRDSGVVRDVAAPARRNHFETDRRFKHHSVDGTACIYGLSLLRLPPKSAVYCTSAKPERYTMIVGNIKTEAPFTQVVVWPGTIVLAGQEAEFEANMLSKLNARVKFLETIDTAPDVKDGCPVQGTGGRPDVFFAIHANDIAQFAIPRFQFGMRWIEDVLGNELTNGEVSIYPVRVRAYRSW